MNQQENNFVIACKLPKMEDSKPVLNSEKEPIYEENYFCRFVTVPGSQNVQAIEWDTDSNFAKIFSSKYEAKQTLKRIETGEPLQILPLWAIK